MNTSEYILRMSTVFCQEDLYSQKASKIDRKIKELLQVLICICKISLIESTNRNKLIYKN